MKAPNASLITSFDIQFHDAGRETAMDNHRGGNMQAMRDLAKSLFFAAVRCADPALAMRRQLERTPLPALNGGQYFVVAVGKAAVPMAREALAQIPKVGEALVVTNSENYCALDGATVMIANHPIPDATSVEAGRAAVELLQRAGPKDCVVALISGGGSALMIAPEGDISLDDYAMTNELLLANGVGIENVNLVRQQIDSLKGGGLLRHAKPAELHGYILSDVIGDDLRAIASGPTVSPIGTGQEAIGVLRAAHLWEQVPHSVRARLLQEEPSSTLPTATNHLIGSNRQSLDALLAAVPKGYNAQIANDALIGDVADAVETILNHAKAVDGPAALIFGGETTVQLHGTGQGGRNQELALRFALGAEGVLRPGWVFLSGGTDGRDGPTDAAGGLVDSHSLARMREAHIDLASLLADNDSYSALECAGGLLLTGGTGTNVADVQILLLPTS